MSPTLLAILIGLAIFVFMVAIDQGIARIESAQALARPPPPAAS